jgi:hypothetical protein
MTDLHHQKKIHLRPHKKNSWLASLAFAKMWAGFLKIFTNF